MDANSGLMVGYDEGPKFIKLEVKELTQQDGQLCHMCRHNVGCTLNNEPFVACNECAFPVCQACYEDARKHGEQSCPSCKTKYKRHKGSPRVEGDEEEDEVDDLENEFNLHKDTQQVAVTMLLDCMNSGSADDPGSSLQLQQSLCITNGEKDPLCITNGEKEPANAMVIRPFLGGGGKRIHPLPSVESGPQFQIDSPPKDTLVKKRLQSWESRKDNLKTKEEGDPDPDDLNHPKIDDSRQPLSREVPIASKLINPYRMIIVSRLVVTCFFFRYRLLNPVMNAPLLWLVSVICEIWFALSWIFDQFQKWSPIRRETYLDRLSLRVHCQESQDLSPEGKTLLSQLPTIDVYVSTVDPHKEPPLVTANTVLSILSVDYPIGKVSCYVSDDGASMLTFEALIETSEFAKKWVPFCKKFNIEPRAPEKYFEQKIDYLKDKVEPAFVKERRSMKREYEEFKVKVNALVAKAKRFPEEGWTMYDGTPWPGNDTSNHAGMIKVFLGQGADHDIEGNELPRLVYVSREKKPGFNHHKKAGAMNALVRVSGVFTNAPYIINLDCDHYINNSKALKEAMCFMMDPDVGKEVCYVQFPQRFDDVDPNDRYANHNTVFFDINMKGLDGIQGPMYVGTGCVFRRQALYGYDAPLENKSQKRKANIDLTFNPEDIGQGMEGLQDEKPLLSPKVNVEKRFGESDVFAPTLMENGGVPQLKPPSTPMNEAIHVIRCGYEDKTEWGKELGWIYGSITEDILTGLKMHCRGWRSIYCMPERDAFKGSAPTNLSDRLEQVHRWALGSVEIFFSRHCPIWYGYKGRLNWCQRLAYINTTIYPITSIALFAYCILPPICLVTEKFIIPEMSTAAALWFLSLFGCIIASAVLEMRWSGVSSEEWWRNEQFWVISGVSAHLFAVCYGLLKVLAGIQTSFTVTSKSNNDDDFDSVTVKWSMLYIPAATVLTANAFGIVIGICDAVNSGWGGMFGKLFFGIWVILHLYPFWLGLMGKRRRHTPTIVIVWSILVAAILSVLWIRIDPFQYKVQGPDLEQCGINC